jgi:hypothetical protein
MTSILISVRVGDGQAFLESVNACIRALGEHRRSVPLCRKRSATDDGRRTKAFQRQSEGLRTT